MENKNSCDGLNLSLDSIDQVAFDFEVSKFFAFGSPIGLVVGSRKFVRGEDYKGKYRMENGCCRSIICYQLLLYNHLLSAVIVIIIRWLRQSFYTVLSAIIPSSTIHR